MRFLPAVKPKCSLFTTLLRRMGPPPQPPRRHFSKCWGSDAHYRPPANQLRERSTLP